jgi:preprotein translocase subunit SecG
MAWAKLLVPFFNVLYVVIALAMIGLILVQRGAGAQAGSGFGSGASGTVFGSHGSANFMSRATSVCATIFFLISLGMGIYISHGGRAKPTDAGGVMSDFQAEAPKPAVSEIPGLPAGVIPAAPGAAPVAGAPAANPVITTEIPAAAEAVPAPAAATPVVPAQVPAPTPTPNPN